MSPDRHRKPLINEEELSELREGRGFLRIWKRFLRFVLCYRGYGRILSEQDGEDVVAEALREEMGSIMNRELGADAVSISLARALNRNRAGAARNARKTLTSIPEFSEPVAVEDPNVVIQFKDVARKLRGYIGQAIEHLKVPDRNLIIDEYRLGRFGFKKQGASPEPSSEGAKKVARCRARKAFRGELETLLRQAEAEGENPDLIHGVRVLLQSRGLAAQVSRRPPRSEN